jgi:hypothetical protein
MSEGAPRELSLAEIDALSMQAIDQITARLPERDYRTPQADDGSSSHIVEFGPGVRFEVIYDREGGPVDHQASTQSSHAGCTASGRSSSRSGR